MKGHQITPTQTLESKQNCLLVNQRAVLTIAHWYISPSNLQAMEETAGHRFTALARRWDRVQHPSFHWSIGRAQGRCRVYKVCSISMLLVPLNMLVLCNIASLLYMLDIQGYQIVKGSIQKYILFYFMDRLSSCRAVPSIASTFF